MTFDEAETVLHAWQDFMEIADKFFNLMFVTVPESFLPYPKEVLIEGLNIMAQYYSDKGDKGRAKVINQTMWGFLNCYEEDEKALHSMKRHLDIMFENPELKNTLIEKLHKSRDNWAKIRQGK